MSRVVVNQIEDIAGTNPVEVADIITGTELSANTGAGLVGYLPAGTGAVASTVQEVLRRSVSFKDFGAVGDGVTNDAVAINLALAAGTDVYINPGNFYIGNATITIPDNCNLYGCGIESKISCDASTRTDPYADHLFIVGSNCTFRDFLVDGNRSGAVQEIRSFYLSLTANVVFDNVVMENHGCGIWVGESDNTKVVNCTFSNGVSKGHIVTDGDVGYAQNLIVQGCFFGSTVEEAIDINAKTRSVIIDSNTFFDNHTGPDIDGTEVIDIGKASDCFDVVISGNRCNNNLRADAFVWCKLNSYNVTITGNTVKNLKTSGGIAAFRVSNASRISITGNTVQNATRALIVQERSSVIGSKYITFQGNTVSGVTEEAVFMSDCTETTSDVVISGNTLQTDTSSTRGVYVIEATKIIISDNTITGFGNDGIVLDTSVTNATVSGNIVSNCSDGMSIASAGAIIQGNSVKSSAVYGIRLSSTGCVVSGNHVTGSAQAALGLVAANNTCITGNVFTANTSYGVHVTSASSNVVLVGNMLAGNTISAIGSVANLTGTPANANNVV